MINPFFSCENLLNPAGMQWAQWIHEQTSGGVAARQPCGGNLWLVQMTSKLLPGPITLCSMGPSVARGVKITGPCRLPPLRTGDGRWRLAALSGLQHSADRQQIFFGSYCTYHQTHIFITRGIFIMLFVKFRYFMQGLMTIFTTIQAISRHFTLLLDK